MKMDSTGKEERSNRIPIRFIDEDHLSATSQQDDDSTSDADQDSNSSADEIGRASIYEDETEVQRRIDRGNEGDAGGDDRDIAGGPDVSETPEEREDQDTVRKGNNSANSPSGEATQPPGNQSFGPAMAELIATRSELKRVEAENAELKETLARRQADFDNFRKRIERERSESYNRVVSEVVRKLLPVVDNLQRALEAEASVTAGESEEFRHFLHGVELISRQLFEALEFFGVKPISAVGKAFDPHLHEAVATQYSEEHEPDTVLQELAKGYTIGDKLLRPAVVKVSSR
jgi:molecular chaperone GrpE